MADADYNRGLYGTIHTSPPSQEYHDGWDHAFGNKVREEQKEVEDGEVTV